MTVQRDMLCSYRYDPLDRVASCVPLDQQSIQRFYRKDRLATEIHGQARHSLVENEAQLLAQTRQEADRIETTLSATDLQRSVLHSVGVGQRQQSAYSPYGHRSHESGLISLLGFNGERREPVTGHYLLGNGHRPFSPVLMQFFSPDRLSPFGDGGLNAYAYCVRDPVNHLDPSGRSPVLASYFKFLEALPSALSGVGNNPVNKFASSVKNPGNPVVKHTVASVSNSKGLHASRIESLDLALPEARDLGKLHYALAEQVEAQKVWSSANEQYSVLKRFVASPPRNKDGTVAVENFNPSEIGYQRDYKRLYFAENRVARAQAALDHVKKVYFERYPRALNEHAAIIRANQRRGSL